MSNGRYIQNPWVYYGRELRVLHAQISEAMTYRQYVYWTDEPRCSYRNRFESALKMSRRSSIQSLARRGLALVQLCEEEQARISQG